jgi:formate dehydrogenase subunit delta
MSKPEKLVAMGHQIAGFFATQSGDPAEAIAIHLTKFWTPSMRATLTAYVENGGAAEPLIKEAVKRLQTQTS